MRLTGSPHAVAIGFAVGVMSAWTPFFGFHIAIALAAAFLLRGSLVAATLGTAFSNPLTIPLILPLTWQIGHRMLDRAPDSGATAAALVRQLEVLHVTELWHPLFEPLTLGALPPAIVSGLCCYLATFVGIRKYRAARAARLAARRAAARPVDKGSRV